MKTIQERKERSLKKSSSIKENKRNNSNSISCNNCCSFNISRNNNKSSI